MKTGLSHNFWGKGNIAEMLTKDVADTLLSGSKVGEIKVKDKVFSLNGYVLEKSSRSAGQKLTAFCFIDMTPLYDLREAIYNEKASVCYVQVDNFDEVMATCHEENRPELLARIDKTITHWTQGLNGLIKKYESDKYLIVLSVKDLKAAINQKFSILEDVKQLRSGTLNGCDYEHGRLMGRLQCLR